MSSIRGTDYPLNPLGEWYPSDLSDHQRSLIVHELDREAKVLHIKFSAINIKIVLGIGGKEYFIELDPQRRKPVTGGASLCKRFWHFLCAVRAAVGEDVAPAMEASAGLIATYNVYADAHGTLKTIVFSEELRPFIRDIFPNVELGAEVEPLITADKLLGILVMQFDFFSQRHEMISHIKEHIHIELT